MPDNFFGWLQVNPIEREKLFVFNHLENQRNLQLQYNTLLFNCLDNKEI